MGQTELRLTADPYAVRPFGPVARGDDSSSLASMTRDQARKVKRSGDFLHSYFAGIGNMPTAGQTLIDLSAGNFLLANAVIAMLAPLRRQSFDAVLDELPPRDEGVPDHAAATPMWETTLDQLRWARADGWRHMPQPSSSYDAPTVFRNSFNLAVAAVLEFAARTGQPPGSVAKTFGDAAILGDVGPSELARGHRGSGHSPQTATWFG